MDQGLNRRARSKKIAEMVMDAFSNGIEMVYVVCGSAHGQEIFDDLNKRWTENFTYILKPSATD
jgi:Cft2 family RNA processing exonuclease